MTRLVACFLFILCPLTWSQTAEDIRILVDTSGSMSSHDPNGLKTDALQMLVEVLPEGVVAGIWSFGSTDRQLVAPARVNLR